MSESSYTARSDAIERRYASDSPLDKLKRAAAHHLLLTPGHSSGIGGTATHLEHYKLAPKQCGVQGRLVRILKEDRLFLMADGGNDRRQVTLNLQILVQAAAAAIVPRATVASGAQQAAGKAAAVPSMILKPTGAATASACIAPGPLNGINRQSKPVSLPQQQQQRQQQQQACTTPGAAAWQVDLPQKRTALSDSDESAKKHKPTANDTLPTTAAVAAAAATNGDTHKDSSMVCNAAVTAAATPSPLPPNTPAAHTTSAAGLNNETDSECMRMVASMFEFGTAMLKAGAPLNQVLKLMDEAKSLTAAASSNTSTLSGVRQPGNHN